MTERLLNLPIRIQHDPVGRIVDKADGQRQFQLASLRFALNPTTKPCLENVQFGFAHRGFEPQHQPVVEVAGIVEPVLVQDQGVGQRADLH